MVIDLLYFGNDSFKRVRVVQGQVGEHFAVELDACFFELAHQYRIRHAFQTGGCAYTYYPQRAEVAFFLLTVAVSINQTFFDGVLGNRPNIFPCAVVTFGEFQDFFLRAREATAFTDLGILKISFFAAGDSRFL